MAFRMNVISKRLTSICNSFTQTFLPPSPSPRRYLFTNSCSVYFAKKKVDEVKTPKCPDFEQYFTKTKKVNKNEDEQKAKNAEGNKNVGSHLDKKDEQYFAKARKVEVNRNDDMRLDKKDDDKLKSPIQPPIFCDKLISAQRRALAEKTSQKFNLFPMKGLSTKIEKKEATMPIKKEEASAKNPSPDTTQPPTAKSQAWQKKYSITKSLNDFTQYKLPPQSLDTKNVSVETDLPQKKQNDLSSQSNTIDDLKTKSQSSGPIINSEENNKNKNNFIWLAAVAAGLCAIGLALLMKESSSNDHSESVVENPIENDDTVEENIGPLVLPKKVPFLIIGGGTASWSACRAIKDHVPNAKVLVVSNETYQPYKRPPLSKDLWFIGNDCTNNLEQTDQRIYFETSDFYSDPMNLLNEVNGGISLLSDRTAKYLKLCERKVVLSDGTEIEYDECLLATGSKPRNLLIFQTAPLRIRNKISFFRSLNDFQSVKDIADRSESVAVIGGGFLASEISFALTVYGGEKLKVYQIFHESGNMGMTLPRYLSDWIKTKLTGYGLSIIPNAQVDSVHMENSKLKLGLLSGQLVVVDHVIVALGSQADVAFAKMSGLKLSSQNCGIAVNENLEALPHLYVAGDAACPPGYFGKETETSYDHAIASGRLAGENMTGKKKPFVHQSMFSSSVAPEFAFESVGLIDAKLKTVGVFSDGADVSTNIGNTNKGVVFYMKNDKVVGILLFNIFNKINIARQVIAEGKELYDLKEVAKRFEIQV